MRPRPVGERDPVILPTVTTQVVTHAGHAVVRLVADGDLTDEALQGVWAAVRDRCSHDGCDSSGCVKPYRKPGTRNDVVIAAPSEQVGGLHDALRTLGVDVELANA